MTIQLLYFDNCPNFSATLDMVKRVARRLGVIPEIDLVKVESPESAEEYQFVGSPTVRVDGIDIDPRARTQTEFGLSCRKYGSSGVPPEAMVEEALRGAKEE